MNAPLNFRTEFEIFKDLENSTKTFTSANDFLYYVKQAYGLAFARAKLRDKKVPKIDPEGLRYLQEVNAMLQNLTDLTVGPQSKVAMRNEEIRSNT